MTTVKAVLTRLIQALKARWQSVVEYTMSPPSMRWSKEEDFQIELGTYYEIFYPTDRCECCGRDYTGDESLRHVYQSLASSSKETAATE